MKLKENVKGIMLGMLIAIILVGVIAFDNAYTEKAINQCVNAGNSQEYCESGLR